MVRRPLRRRHRASERGATFFVVVLAITLLTGIGLFTVHSSALLARAAGNEREAMQTTYLAELGTLTTLSIIGMDPQAYVEAADKQTEDCRAYLGMNTALYGLGKCVELPNSKMVIQTGAALWTGDSFGTTKDVNTSAYAITGLLNTETSDLEETGEYVPGMSKDFTFREGKITTTATLQPVEVGATCVENFMQAAGQHVTRAHVRIGPVKRTTPDSANH